MEKKSSLNSFSVDIIFKLLSKSALGVCVTDAKGIFVDMNEGFCKIFGLQKDGLTGTSFTGIVAEDQQTEIQQQYNDLISSDRLTAAEWHLQNKDGSFIWVSVNAELYEFEEGKQFVFLSFSDITETKNQPKGDAHLLDSEILVTDHGGDVIAGLIMQTDNTDQEKVIDALKEAEAKCRMLFYSSPSPQLIYDFETYQIVDANDSAVENYGYKRDEFLQMNMVQLRPPEDHLAIVEIIKAHQNQKGAIQFGVWRHLKKDGTIIKVEKTGHNIQYNGRACMFEICVDVTEKIKIEKSLKHSNERYEYVTKATFDAIWDLNFITNDLYWGDGFERLFGYKTENNQGDIIGWYENIHEKDRVRVLNSINNLIKGVENNWSEEYQFMKANGEMAFVHNKGIVIRNKKGKAVRMIGAMQDITVQKKEEQQLKLFKSAITNATDAVLITESSSSETMDCRIIYANEAFAKMSGYTSDEVIGKTPKILQGPLTSSVELDKLKQSILRWEPCEVEVINYKKNGDRFWTNISIVPVSGDKEGHTHWILIQKDITEWKQEEAEKELFYELLKVINGNESLEIALTIVIEKIGNHFGFSYAEAWLNNIDETRMLFKANWAKDETKALFRMNPPIEYFERGVGMLGKVWEQNCSLYYEDIQQSPFLRKENALLAGLSSVLTIPIFLNDRIIALFSFYHDRPFTREQLHSDLLSKISKQIGSDIQKSRTEDELNRFFHLSPDLMCIAGFDGYFKKINRAVSKLLNYSEKELLAKKVNDFVYEPDRERTLMQWDRIKAGERLLNYENRYVTKNGEIKWLSWTSTPIMEEAVVFAVAKDITEKKKMELERENILNSISDYFYALDNQLNFTYINTPAQQLVQKKPAELIGKNIFTEFPDISEGIFYENIRKVLKEKVPIHFEVYIEKFSCWFEESFYPTDDGISVFFRSINDRKKADQEIKAAFDEKNTILESITDGFLTIDRNGIVTYWNKEAERILKVSRANIVGKNIVEVLPDAVFLYSHSEYNRALRDNVAVHFEQYFHPLNILLEVSVYPSEIGLSIYFKDITETKRLIVLEQLEKEVLERNASQEFDLRDTINFYLTEIEKLHVGMTCSVLRLEDDRLYHWAAPNLPENYIKMIDGGQIGENQGSCGTAAYLKQKVIAADIENDIRWAMYKDYALAIGFKACWSFPILSSGGLVLGTFALYYKEIKEPSIEEENTIKRSVNILKVIIENKHFENEILEINERFNLVTKATNDIIWDWNIKTDEVFRTGDGLFGIIENPSLQEATNNSYWQSRIHPEDYETVKEKMNLFLADPSATYWSESFRFLKLDGKYAYFFEKGYLTRNEKKEPVRMIGATRDITLQMETEQILKNLNDKLERRAEELVNSNVELERFAYVVSHDLQEPLRMVNGFLQLLQKKYESQIDETGQKYIHLAVDGANRMRQLIYDLLQFSRITSAAVELKPVDSREIVEELIYVFGHELQHTNGKIIVDDLPIIMADKTPVTQLFQNLIGNALKYRSEKSPLIHISCEEGDLYWTFMVEDNGLGIDPKFYEKIFVIFQRLHNKNEYSGTGIGLAICKKIVEKFNGTIWVESNPGNGSRFFFSIPK